MKKILLLILSLILGLITVNAALAQTAPTLIRSIDVSAAIGPGVITNHEIIMAKPDLAMVVYEKGGAAEVSFISTLTGTELKGDSLNLLIRENSLDVFGNWAIACSNDGASEAIYQVYDITSPAFITNKGSPTLTGGFNSKPTCRILEQIGNNLHIAVANITGPGDVVRTFNVVTGLDTGFNQALNSDHNNIVVIDRTNKVYASSASLINYSNNLNQNAFFNLTASQGTFEYWNGDSSNPIYLTTNGHMVITNGPAYSPIQVTGAQYNSSIPTVQPVLFQSQSRIYSRNGTKWYNIDFSNPAAPTVTRLTGDILGTLILPEPGNITDGVNQFSTLNRTTQTLFLYQFQTGPVGPGAGTRPSPNIQFLGTNVGATQFVFRGGVTDNEGGNMFTALDIGIEGEFTGGIVRENIDWDTVTDLNFINEDGFCPAGNISFSSGLIEFDASGSFIRNHSVCLFPTTVDFTDVEDSDSVNNQVLFTSSWQHRIDTTQGEGSITWYDAVGGYIGDLEFNIDLGVNQVNVSTYNGTINFLGNGTWLSTDFFTVRNNFDFVNQQMNITLFDRSGTQILSNVIVPFANPASSLGSVVYNQVMSSQILYVDYVQLQYTASAQSFPPYSLFVNVLPGETRFKSVTATSRPFGTYDARFYATDEAFGLNDYTSFDSIQFTYDDSTPVLTAQEIDALDTTANGSDSDFIEGDVATDLLPTLLDSIGIRGSGSKFIIGFIVLVLLAWGLQGIGSEAIILILVMAAVALSFLGFFPVWFLVLMGIIAAGLLAVALRRVVAGGT